MKCCILCKHCLLYDMPKDVEQFCCYRFPSTSDNKLIVDYRDYCGEFKRDFKFRKFRKKQLVDRIEHLMKKEEIVNDNQV